MMTDDDMIFRQLFGAFWCGQSCIKKKKIKCNVNEVDAELSAFANVVVKDELSSEVLDELTKFLGLNNFSLLR